MSTFRTEGCELSTEFSWKNGSADIALASNTGRVRNYAAGSVLGFSGLILSLGGFTGAAGLLAWRRLGGGRGAIATKKAAAIGNLADDEEERKEGQEALVEGCGRSRPLGLHGEDLTISREDRSMGWEEDRNREQLPMNE